MEAPQQNKEFYQYAFKLWGAGRSAWRQRCRIFFLRIWGLKFYFALCVYAQNAQDFMGNSNVHSKQAKNHP